MQLKARFRLNFAPVSRKASKRMRSNPGSGLSIPLRPRRAPLGRHRATQLSLAPQLHVDALFAAHNTTIALRSYSQTCRSILPAATAIPVASGLGRNPGSAIFTLPRQKALPMLHESSSEARE
jgi:hypothetical protein